jgi:histidinol-phosphate aminotransferase
VVPSRRSILRQVGISAAASVVIPSLSGASLSAALPSLISALPAGPIRLDKNENAYGPSEKSISAMQTAMNLSNRYPSPEVDELVGKIATLHRVKPEQVTIGAGSIEILRMTAFACLSPGKKLILASPTFNAVAHFASSLGSEVVAVPLSRTYAHDLDTMSARADSLTGLIYICNPNNPTGTLTLRNDIESFLRKLPGSSYVLIDEAYHHYVHAAPSAYKSFIDHQVDDDRVIVARTFSTIYGLAGTRVGYAVSSPQVARSLSQDRLPFGVNSVGARAAAAALDDGDYVRLSAKRNIDDRQEFLNQANARMVRWIDSHTNFVMLNGGLLASQVIEHFQKQNVLLGPLVPEMPKYVRVSIGRREEMLEFWRVWNTLPPHAMPM